MTKNEMLKELYRREKEKGIDLDGIGQNSNKSTIQNAINCLLCPDDLLEKYLTVLTLKYPYIGEKISENGDFKKHRFNRLYVFNTARMILAD